MSPRRQRLLAWSALAITTLLAVLPLMLRGPSCGQDFDFHLLSWLETAQAWHSGVPNPHWIASANYGAGEPRLIFYPPASWLLGGLLGALPRALCISGAAALAHSGVAAGADSGVAAGADSGVAAGADSGFAAGADSGFAAMWTAAPILFTAICLFASGLAMRRLARAWLSPAAATAASCLLIASPYLLFVAYERAAYGELLAAAFIPLALLLSTQTRPRIAALAAVVAATWLTNAPSGVMLCYTLLTIALLRLATPPSHGDGRWQAPLRLGAAAALGLALAGDYLVPAVSQQRWVQISRALAPGLRVEDSFLFARTGDLYHDQVLHTASLVACTLLALCALGAFLWGSALRQHSMQWLAALAGLIFLLQLPISAPLWHLAPHLAYLQFPWRWLLVLSPVAALLTTGALARRLPRLWMIATVAALALTSLFVCTRDYYQVCDEEDNVRAQLALFDSGIRPAGIMRGIGVEGTDEYTPRDADNSAVAQNLPAARVLRSPDGELPDSTRQSNPDWHADPTLEQPAQVDIRQWSAEHRDLTIRTTAPGFAVLRLMDYPAWQVTRNGVAAVRLHRDDGLLTIALPAGSSHIEIKWSTTPDVWAGRGLTLLALCIWVPLLWRERRASVTP